MTRSKVKKTKKVANLRIYVERAINQIIYFSILKGIIQVTACSMIQHVEYIISTL